MLSNKSFLRIFFMLSLLIFVLKGPAYCFSGSNCDDYNSIRGETTVEISFETLDNMIFKSEKDDDNLCEFLKELKEELEPDIKDTSLKGLLFYFREIDSRVENCNIYLRFEDGRKKKFMYFPTEKDDDCSKIANCALNTFLEAKNRYYSETKKGMPVKGIRYEVVTLFDPLSSDINKIVRRHPNFEKFLATKGVSLIEIPVAVVLYTPKTFEKEQGVTFTGMGSVKYTAKLTPVALTMAGAAAALGSFNAKVGGFKKMEAKSKIFFPIHFMITKEKLEKSETYKIKKGDTLKKIAKENYKRSNFWGMLFLLNKDKITDPNKLKTGTEIKIPRIFIPSVYSFIPFKQAIIK